MKRWSGLYSNVQHARLQTAMMNCIAAKVAGYKKKRAKNIVEV
jgi:hypothetical protein